MSKQSIALDLDDVINNLCHVWIDRYNKDYDDDMTLEAWNTWAIDGIVKPECSIKIYDYLKEPGFFFNVDIQEGARETIEKLVEKYEVYIVTAFAAHTCVDKTNWVKKHLPFFDIKRLVFCTCKGIINTDFLIDDGGHNITDFKQEGIVFDTAHNRNITDHKRVHNWKDIADMFL